MKRGLSLSGGGVFGIGQAEVLSKCPISLIQNIDFYAGTSIGAINAALLAFDVLPPEDMNKFFKFIAPKVFNGYWWRRFKPIAPKYNANLLELELKNIFGNRKLKDAKTPIFITATNLNTGDLKVFSSLDQKDGEWFVWEVLRCASAAQTYFSPYKNFADGGVYANDPSMVAVAAASKVLNYDITEIGILSIGTGESEKSMAINTRWSFIGWGFWLINILLNGASKKMHEYFVDSLPIQSYVKIQFERNEKWNLASVDDMKEANKTWSVKYPEYIQKIKDFLTK